MKGGLASRSIHSGPKPVLLSLAIAFLAIASFYVWTARSDNLSWHFGRAQTDYYNRLVHGFLKGQLSLDTPVPEELLRVPDPHDPAQRPPGVALHDASLFQGKYYIYFGVVPAVFLLLPFRAITRVDLPLGAAVTIFAVAGYGCVLWLLAEWRRRFFPRVGPVMLAVVAVAFGFASMAAILVRRGSMYDLPIASGYAFAMAALACGWRALVTRRAAWVAATSVCWGLAIGSRPVYLLAPLSLALAWPLWRHQATTVKRKLALAAVGPLVAIGGALAWYNYARFGNPLEFGLRYILSGVYEARIEHFRPRYAAWNFRAYFFALPEWGRYFPFLHPVPIAAARPRQHFGMDIPFGLLVEVPFLWLAAAGWLPMRGSGGELKDERRIWLASVGWLGASVVGFLLCFYAAMARYLVDFAPALVLLAAMGACALVQRLAEGRPAALRQGVGVGVGMLAAVSVFTTFLFATEIYDRVRQFNPAAYAALARIANAPVHLVEQWREGEFGPLTLRVIFPAEVPAERGEELLKTGWPDATDRVLAFYPDTRHVQLGFEHAGAPVVRSAPLPVERGVPHLVRISLGSLFPPETHPNFRSWSADERTALLRRVRIEFDGQRVLDRYQRFYAAAPGTVSVGYGFSGELVNATRDGAWKHWREQARGEPIARPVAQADADGVLHLRVRFPAGEPGRREPLVVSGETGRGDLLSVEYLSGGRLRFLLDHWGRQPYLSPAVSYQPGRDYRLDAGHPFYAPDGATRTRAGEGELTVSLDGRRVWACEPLFYPTDPKDIFVGENPLGGSTTGTRFTGMLEPAK